MQSKCPRCSANLSDDYGMVTCGSCKAMIYIDMDGQAMVTGEVAASQPVKTATKTTPSRLSNETPDLAPEFQPLDLEPAVEPTPATKTPPSPVFEQSLIDLQPPPSADQPPEYNVEFAAPAPLTNEPATTDSPTDSPTDETPNLAEPPPEDEFAMDRILGYENDKPDVYKPEAEFGPPGDPLGINEYANSEISQAKDGLLTFKILISGIDSKEMRESLRSALDDQRFGWNPGDLMSRISKGALQIDNVSPVKAVILVNRIKRLPITVRWEQYAITQMDSN